MSSITIMSIDFKDGTWFVKVKDRFKKQYFCSITNCEKEEAIRQVEMYMKSKEEQND